MLKNPQTLRSYPKAQITQGADRVSAPTRRSPPANEFLRTEETGSAPPDGISINVKCHRATRPVTPRAFDRPRNRIARVGRVAGLHGVSRELAMALPTIAPVTTPAATPTPTAQPQQRASAGGAANRETVIDVAAASESKVLFMVVS